MKKFLESLDACRDAVEWVGDKTLDDAWNTCERGDWRLWIAGRLDIDRKLLVLAACECARTSLVYVPVGETRPLRAIETAEAWCRGETTIEDVRTAAHAAAYAAYAAYAAAHAAYAAAHAAYAATTAYAAAYASDAAYAAAHAAAHAAYAAADAYAYDAAAYVSDRANSLKKMAKIVRSVINIKDVREAIGKDKS